MGAGGTDPNPKTKEEEREIQKFLASLRKDYRTTPLIINYEWKTEEKK
jgi:hypothetical protein